MRCPSYNIGARTRPMAVMSGFYESQETTPSGNARGIVPAHCNDHQNGQQSGHILNHHFVLYHPSGRQDDTDRVVARVGF